MGQFKYQLPSGAVFLVDAPQGTTQGQADFVFYTQVAAGTFAGYSAGQTLTSVATRLAEFNLSRIERDTAGVENATVLSIIEQSPVIAPVPDVSRVPLQNPINQADIAVLDLNAIPQIGPLPPEQVAALIAQIKNLPKPEGSVTAYGFTCAQLEAAGVFKPGVCSRDTFSCCLKSPDSWTGNYNVNSYNDLINNETAQVQIQAALLQNSYNSLTQAGVIQATPEPAVSLTTGEVWVNGRGLVEATAAGVLTGKTKSGSNLFNQIYGAVNGLSSASGLTTALGAVTLAGSAVNSINNLVSGGAQNISSALGVASGISSSISNLGTSVQSIANGLVNTNLTSIADQGVSILKNTINGGINSITNTVAGSVGALMTNASQFGTAITGLWAGGGLTGSIGSLGGLASNLGLGGVASSINSVTNLASSLSSGVSSLTNGLTGLSNLSSLNSLTGLTSGAIGNLGSLISGSGLGGLASNLEGLAGSASSALGSLTGMASGALGSATELVQGTLGNLGSLASDSLGSLTSSLDLAGKMSSFSIDFSIFSNSGLASKVQKAPAFTNTVDRATVDVAVQQVLGNPKIPTPSFEIPPNISTAAAQLDINFAKNILQSITSPVTNMIGQAQQIAGQVQQTVGQAQQIATNVGGAINRLTG